MATLMQASREFATRRGDERFINLPTMAATLAHSKELSRGTVVSNRKIECRPMASDPMKAIEIVGPSGAAYEPTHWSFGQLAQKANAPASYLRTLPAPMIADCINYGLHHGNEADDVGLLLRKNGKSELSAVTGPAYGRVWNADIADMLTRRFHGSDWTVPGEFGRAVQVTKENTTLYAGDRDMFVFLADEQNKISMPNRRNGKSGELSRGFFVWNSEVGSATLGFATFLFDYVCCNRIVWGAEGFREIKIRHTASAPDRYIENVLPVLEDYSASAAKPIEDTLKAAQAAKVASLEEFLEKRRYSAKAIKAIGQAHIDEEDRPVETIWDVTTAITAYAKSIVYQDERVTLERDAGKILDLVAVR